MLKLVWSRISYKLLVACTAVLSTFLFSAKPVSHQVGVSTRVTRRRHFVLRCAGSPSRGGVLIFIHGENQKEQDKVDEPKTKDDCEEVKGGRGRGKGQG